MMGAELIPLQERILCTDLGHSKRPLVSLSSSSGASSSRRRSKSFARISCDGGAGITGSTRPLQPALAPEKSRVTPDRAASKPRHRNGLKIFDFRLTHYPVFGQNWSVVKDWKIESRYEVIERALAVDLYSAITARQHGVLRWLRQNW